MPAVHLKDSEFEEKVLKSESPVLVDFFATWCGPCRMMAPIIDELSEEYQGKVTVYKMDVDENPQTASKYGIQSIPTLIFFRGGQPMDSAIGFQSKDALKSKLASL